MNNNNKKKKQKNNIHTHNHNHNHNNSHYNSNNNNNKFGVIITAKLSVGPPARTPGRGSGPRMETTI